MKKLAKLFISMFIISAFTFGGGYVIVSLMKDTFVDKYHWLEEKEMLDLISIAQCSPGAIAVNGAIVVGYRLAGIPGIIVSVIATITPPILILSIISILYTNFISNPWISLALQGMQIGVIALLVSVCIDFIRPYVQSKNTKAICIILTSFVLVHFFQINVFYLILAGLILGVVSTRRSAS